MWKRIGMTGVLVLACGVAGFEGGCASPSSSAPPRESQPVEESLYQRMGGHAVMESIASGWVDKVVADPALKARFGGTEVDKFKARMTAFLCEVSGGPEVYTGKDMKTAHRGMNASDAEWTAFMDDLKAVMDNMKIAAVNQEELLVKLEPMKGSIVGQ